jgi:hypothetical protein
MHFHNHFNMLWDRKSHAPLPHPAETSFALYAFLAPLPTSPPPPLHSLTLCFVLFSCLPSQSYSPSSAEVFSSPLHNQRDRPLYRKSRSPRPALAARVITPYVPSTRADLPPEPSHSLYLCQCLFPWLAFTLSFLLFRPLYTW